MRLAPGQLNKAIGPQPSPTKPLVGGTTASPCCKPRSEEEWRDR
jgi:hypothetical protein